MAHFWEHQRHSQDEYFGADLAFGHPQGQFGKTYASTDFPMPAELCKQTFMLRCQLERLFFDVTYVFHSTKEGLILSPQTNLEILVCG